MGKSPVCVKMRESSTLSFSYPFVKAFVAQGSQSFGIY